MKRGKAKSWNSTLRPRSVKQQKVYVERRKFVSDFLKANPYCEVRTPLCTGRSVDVHERIRRSHNGAIVPGQEGKRENSYVAICRNCHTHVTEHPEFARAWGWEIA